MSAEFKTDAEQPEKRGKSRMRRVFSVLGPGVVTGAADDDPSAVTTYSIAGAHFGTSLLWSSFLTWPFLAAVQMTCARIGMVTGKGLVENLKEKFPKFLVWMVALVLFSANTLNIGADLAGMAELAEMLTSISAQVYVVLFGILIAWATIKFPYQKIARILKWLCLALFSYVVVGFMVVDDWKLVLKETFLISLPQGKEQWSTLVAIFGTIMSPYLFFWQASQDVEEEKVKGRKEMAERLGASQEEIADRKLDVRIGTFFSRFVMFFIIITTAFTLHRKGIKIETSREAAEALSPIAGSFSTVLYAIGIWGVGFLAIPVLSGSAAYALAELFCWRHGLDRKPRSARRFYSIIGISVALGILMNLFEINPVRILFLSAIVNGLLAPFILLGILFIASDSKLMLNEASSRLNRALVATTTFVMLASALAMFLT